MLQAGRMRINALTFVCLFAVAGCYGNYLKATSQFAGTTAKATDDLADLSGVVVDLCVQEAQLEFLTARLSGNQLVHEHVPGEVLDPTSFGWSTWFEKHTFTDPAAPATTTTWKKLCAGYKPLTEALQNALASISAYGVALGRVSDDSKYDGSDVTAIAGSVTSIAGSLSGGAATYKDALGTLGSALGDVAKGLMELWVGHKAAALMGDADPSVTRALAALGKLIDDIRAKELANIRRAFPGVLMALEAQKLTHELFEAPPRGDLTIKKRLSRDPNDVLDELEFERAWTDRLDAIDGKLGAFKQTVDELAKAHATLTKAWAQQGKPQGDGDLKTAVGLLTDVITTINAFRSHGGGK